MNLEQLIVRNGRVLDLVKGQLSEPLNIRVEGNRITEISDRPLDQQVSNVIEANGMTVMPGMIDCHVHVVASHMNLGINARQPNVLATIRALPILEGMLRRGFTSVRDAGGADWSLMQAIDSGLIRGPKIYPSGRALSQTGGHGDFRKRGETFEACSCSYHGGAIARIVDGVDAVRLAVREEIQNGATQIKIMASGGVASPTDPIGNTQYSEEEITAIVREAEAAQTYVMAHAYTPRAISRAVRCGVRTIEHGNLIDKDTAELMAERGAFVVPTLITYEATAEMGARYGMDPESLLKVGVVREAGRRSLEIYAAAGVKMGFGSDLLGEMHYMQLQELEIRASLLGNLEALRSATTVAASIVAQNEKLGVVDVGAVADLIVVEGNPLDNIRVLSDGEKNIKHVIQQGQRVEGLL
jgi:imidazolonepropionase-like amidohydrolase